MYQQMEVVERLCFVPHSSGSDPQTPLYTDMSDQNSGPMLSQCWASARDTLPAMRKRALSIQSPLARGLLTLKALS